MTLRENILNHRRTPRVSVSPSWLKDTDTPTVELARMSLAVRFETREAALIDEGIRDKDGAPVRTFNDSRYRAALVIETAYVPGTNDKVFKPADLDTLLAMDAADIDELADPALALNAANKTAAADAEKN